MVWLLPVIFPFTVRKSQTDHHRLPWLFRFFLCAITSNIESDWKSEFFRVDCKVRESPMTTWWRVAKGYGGRRRYIRKAIRKPCEIRKWNNDPDWWRQMRETNEVALWYLVVNRQLNVVSRSTALLPRLTPASMSPQRSQLFHRPRLAYEWDTSKM